MWVAIAALIIIVGLLVFYIFLAEGSTRQQIEKRFKAIGIVSVHSDATNKAMELPLYSRLFLPLFTKLSNLFHRLTPQAIHRYVASKLQEAGEAKNVDIRPFLLRWGLVLVVLLLLVLAIDLYALHFPLIKVLLWEMIAALLGIALPFLVLRMQISKRKKDIRRSLADIIDILLVSIQAGNTFESAISRLGDQMTGPLVEELTAMQQQVRIGVSRRNALENLAERCNVVEVSLLTASLIQSEQLGVSIAKVLDVQAQSLRKRRVLQAREAAMKAAIKLLIPLVLFILPVLFMVILGPAVISFMRNMQ